MNEAIHDKCEDPFECSCRCSICAQAWEEAGRPIASKPRLNIHDESYTSTNVTSRDGAQQKYNQVVLEALSIACHADEKFGDFASAHEAYGVLVEEVAELLDAVRLRQGDSTRLEGVRAEALDIAAVALRLAEQARRVVR